MLPGVDGCDATTPVRTSRHETAYHCQSLSAPSDQVLHVLRRSVDVVGAIATTDKPVTSFPRDTHSIS
jgi:hypothetical protein